MIVLDWICADFLVGRVSSKIGSGASWLRRSCPLLSLVMMGEDR